MFFFHVPNLQICILLSDGLLFYCLCQLHSSDFQSKLTKEESADNLHNFILKIDDQFPHAKAFEWISSKS